MVRTGLWLHTFSYKLLSVFVVALEKDSLHPKHRIMDYHKWFADQIEPDWHVLDVGCGHGALTRTVSEKTKNILGIDIHAGNVRKAERLNPGIQFIHGDATSYCFESRFDAVVLSNVLEHIENRVEFLRALSRVTQRILVRVPLIDRDWLTLYKKEHGLEYRLDSTHFIEYTFEEFQEEVREANLALREWRIRFGEIYAVLSSHSDAAYSGQQTSTPVSSSERRL